MNETRWYCLSPVDAWFFRDGRPFNRGEDSQASSNLFPPHATTVGGGLRASLARGLGWDGRRWTDSIRQRLGGHESLGPIELSGPFLACRKPSMNLLFPMPAHILGAAPKPKNCEKQDGDEKRSESPKWIASHVLAPSKAPVITDLGPIHVPISIQHESSEEPSESRAKSTDQYLLTAEGMTAVCAGRLPSPDQCVHRDRVSSVESRTGIARDPRTHAVTLGDLYSPNFVRVDERAGLIVGIRGLTDDMHPEAMFPLGGENRLAACDAISEPDTPVSNPPASGVTALIALTHCRFEDGPWFGAGPGDPASRLHPSLQGHIVCAAIDRPIGIGGWKTEGKGSACPTAMQPYVPAGSVWWLSEPPPASLAQIGSRTAWGFGQVIAGRATFQT